MVPSYIKPKIFYAIVFFHLTTIQLFLSHDVDFFFFHFSIKIYQK